MKDVHVSTEGVTKLLQKRNPAKASRPDLLPARVLEELASEISPYLTTIFQRSFDTCFVPKECVLTPFLLEKLINAFQSTA